MNRIFKKGIILFFILICFGSAKAQFHGSIFNNKKYDTIPRIVYKIDPFMFFYRFSHLSLSAEFRVKPYSSVQIEAGYVTRIFTETPYYNDLNIQYNGYRINPEYRLYSPGSKYVKYYLGAEAYLQHVFINREINYGINCVDFNCDYYQLFAVRQQNLTYGLNFISGLQGAYEGLPFLDFFVGLGARFQRNLYSGIPTMPNVRAESSMGPRYSSRPHVTIGVKIGMVRD